MMIRRTLLTAAVTVWTCAACSGDPPVDIGDHVTGSKLSDYAGAWDGYAEAFSFPPSTSDRLRITIDENGQGTIEFGDEPLLPPPTDPEVGYPVDYDARFNFSGFSSQPAGTTRVTSGFLYPIRSARPELDRLNIGVFSPDLFSQWCVSQTPVLIVSGEVMYYKCVQEDWPRIGYDLLAPDGTVVPVDGVKYQLCAASVCACSESACMGALPNPDSAPYDVEMDLRLEDRGSKLVGTLALGSGARVAVRLTRN